MAEALGDGLGDPVPLADGLAVELAEPDGEELVELDGRAEPEVAGDADVITDGESLGDEVADVVGVGARLDASGAAVAGADDDAAASLGTAAAVSPTRPVRAVSKALLAMALGSEEAEALAAGLAVATAEVELEAEALTDGVADIDAGADARAVALGVALAVAESDGEVEGVADEDVLGDADALGEIVSDGDALGDGDAPSRGSTMHGSRGEVTCSEAFVDASAAIAAEPVPKVARIRLAETVMATPLVRRTPRLRA